MKDNKDVEGEGRTVGGGGVLWQGRNSILREARKKTNRIKLSTGTKFLFSELAEYYFALIPVEILYIVIGCWLYRAQWWVNIPHL